MTQDEKQFFRALGARVAELRRAQGLTQGRLGELLGVSQQSVAAYEVGRLRIGVSVLARLGEIFGVSVETLIGAESRSAARRGPAPKLAQQMARISRLPRPKQRFVVEVIESVLAQAARQGPRP
jgi:transcriptional regulator with XRE-family HTH domain